MLDSLQFVKGAVAKKDFAPVLTHFCIAARRIIGYNGKLALSGPIDLDIVANPKAAMLVQAVSQCTSQVVIVQLPNGNLSIASGEFRCTVECSPEPFPSLPLDGERISFQYPIVPVLKKLAPFMSEDASRPWSQGILFRDQSAYATNNIELVEYWTGSTAPVEIVLPADAVTEMVRIGEEPEYLSLTEHYVTVMYPGDRWLRTSTLNDQWPDLNKVLNRQFDYRDVPASLFSALGVLKPFLTKDGLCYIVEGKVTTSLDPDSGAECEVADLVGSGKFSWRHLMLLDKIADRIDFTAMPAGFIGERLRGVILGQVV